MKKIKNKYIRLTETELHALIREEVKKLIPLIMEYAVPRKKFVDDVFNLLGQICQNWCLIRFVTLSKIQNDCVAHWKTELIAHMSSIANEGIKSGNNPTSRLKAILEAFDWADFDDSTKAIEHCIAQKFEKEGLPTNGEPFTTVLFDFKHEVEMLAKLMANKDVENIKEYVSTL